MPPGDTVFNFATVAPIPVNIAVFSLLENTFLSSVPFIPFVKQEARTWSGETTCSLISSTGGRPSKDLRPRFWVYSSIGERVPEVRMRFLTPDRKRDLKRSFYKKKQCGFFLFTYSTNYSYCRIILMISKPIDVKGFKIVPFLNRKRSVKTPHKNLYCVRVSGFLLRKLFFCRTNIF